MSERQKLERDVSLCSTWSLDDEWISHFDHLCSAALLGQITFSASKSARLVEMGSKPTCASPGPMGVEIISENYEYRMRGEEERREKKEQLLHQAMNWGLV